MNPPPVALLMVAGICQRLLTARKPPTRSSRVTAAVLAAASAGILAAPAVEFRRRRTTVDPRASAEPSHLVTTGINAGTRNPMYVGMAGLLLASVAQRKPRTAGLLPLLAFVVWIDRRQIPEEERALLQRFGDDYAMYRRRVPRWLGIPRGPESRHITAARGSRTQDTRSP